ncbi:MAG: protocatechuate 4,5-dioxygenase subunit alpha, partial [Hydrogenophaga sp.]|uniref:protocatechuate 4,5-dioxygenase subunit alpha n=1 Tax=Hydrogenophaga sp. TaxID=1904254 RepID=UPI003D9AF8DB
MIFDLFIFGNRKPILPFDPRPSTPRRRQTVSKTIPGTTPFDGGAAQKGYALNKMCFSFNHKANRDALLADPEAYMQQYGLNAEQAEAIRSQQVLALIAAGGNAYYLAKFAGIFGLDMQDIGAQQTGMTKEQFKAKLVAAND